MNPVKTRRSFLINQLLLIGAGILLIITGSWLSLSLECILLGILLIGVAIILYILDKRIPEFTKVSE